MDIKGFFRQFQRWPTIRAVPPATGSAVATPPTVRYVRGCDLPQDVDAASVEPWRIDSTGEQWFRVEEGSSDEP